MTLEHNLAHVYAAGFYAVYIEPETMDRQALIAHLTSVFEDAYRSGLGRGQRDFAHALLTAIGDRATLNADELRTLISAIAANRA